MSRTSLRPHCSHFFALASATTLLLAGCGGGGGGGGSSSTAPIATVRPIPSGSLGFDDRLRVEFATRWNDGGLATFLENLDSGNGGLIGVHHGPTGEIDWTFEQRHQGLGWSFAHASAPSSAGTWFTWTNDVALVARIAPNGTIAAQTELTFEPGEGLAGTFVDGAANAYFATTHGVTRLDANAAPLWSYRILGESPTEWRATDPAGGIVFGATLESGALRAASLAPNGTVRWSREISAGAESSVRVVRSTVESTHATTLLLETHVFTTSTYDLAIARIAPDGSLSMRSLHPAGVAADAWGLYDYLDVDEGRGGWIVVVYEFGQFEFEALHFVRIDERGEVGWTRRIPYDAETFVSYAPGLDGSFAFGALQFDSDTWVVTRCDANGNALWTREVTLPTGLQAQLGGGATTLPEGPVSAAEARLLALQRGASGQAQQGIGFFDLLARADGGLVLSASSAAGWHFAGFDAAGATEWTTNIGVAQQLVRVVPALGAAAYATSYDQQTGFYSLMRLAPQANERWRVRIPSFTVPIPTNDGGVVAPISLELGLPLESAGWVSVTRLGTSDATCIEPPTALPAADVTISSSTAVWETATSEDGVPLSAQPFLLEGSTRASSASADVAPVAISHGSFCPL